MSTEVPQISRESLKIEFQLLPGKARLAASGLNPKFTIAMSSLKP
jgi:hypothetical protein